MKVGVTFNEGNSRREATDIYHLSAHKHDGLREKYLKYVPKLGTELRTDI